MFKFRDEAGIFPVKLAEFFLHFPFFGCNSPFHRKIRLHLCLL